MEQTYSKLGITMKVIGLLMPRYGKRKNGEYYAKAKLEQYCENVINYKNRDEIASFNPDWVIVLCDDEIFSPRMDYMFNSLILNDYVNIWTSKCLYFWDSEDVYRIDGLWGNMNFPIMYRFIPEIDYQWKENNLIPCNQPGPTEDSSVPLFSYTNLTESRRMRNYRNFMLTKDYNNHITKMHYKSLFDDEIRLERWIN
jgi:hypothetical protein